MAVDNWAGGVSADWSVSSDWSSGAAPGASDSATIAASGTYEVTLFQTGTAASLYLGAAGATLYDAGLLSVSGTITLAAGTLALAYGTVGGGTLALTGGTFLAGGGTLDAVTVQGPLAMTTANAALTVRDGLVLQGAGGVGAGSLTLTGGYATLGFDGSQTLDNAVLSIGATAGAPGAGGATTLAVLHDYSATAGATLTLGSHLWIRETGANAILAAGPVGAIGPTLPDAMVNLGTLTAATFGGTLTLAGSGNFTNAGTIGISNGATLVIASAGFANTGSISVIGATLAFGGDFASSRLTSLGAVTLSGGRALITGVMENAGATLALGTGSAVTAELGTLQLAGTIRGGTITDTGGGLGFTPGTGVLDGVSYRGTLDLSAANAAVTLIDGTAILAASGTGTGAINLTGAGATLLLQGNETLNAATISLGGTGTATLGTSDPWLASTGTTATLGPNLRITQTGALAAIDANASNPIPSFGVLDTVVNQGTISAAISSGTLSIGGAGSFINQGDIAIGAGEKLSVGAANFANTGTLSLAAGASATLGGAASPYGTVPTWSNTGLISVNGGTLTLAGSVATSQLGNITLSGGSVVLAGTLVNTGGTLALGAGGALPALGLSGTIRGGTVRDAGGLLTPLPGGAAVLDGVSYAGTLTLAQPNAYLRVLDGLALLGGASLTGAGSVLAFQGSQTLSAGAISIGATGSAAAIDIIHLFSAASGSTLTLGPALTVTQSGLLAALGEPTDYAGDAILNAGTITGAVAFGTLTLGGADFLNQGTASVSNGDTLSLAAAAFSNTGNLAVSNAALSIGGSLTLAQLGHLSLSNAAVSVAGTLDLTGTTLALGNGTAFGHLALTGTLRAGTITDAGGGLGVTGAALLDGVSYRGTLDLSRPFAQLAIENGLAVTDLSGTQYGTIMLTGAAARLEALGNNTIDNATLYVGSAGNNYYGQHIATTEIAAGPGGTLTIGAHATFRSGGLVGQIGDAALGNWTDTVINDGLVMATTPGGTLTLAATNFINYGGMPIGSGGNINVSDVAFTNIGNISLNPGSSILISLLDYFAAPNSGPTLFSNAGTLHMLGGAVGEQTDAGLFPLVPMSNLPNALIQGEGTVNAPIINGGRIESSFGPLDLSQSITGTGAIMIDAGTTLELGGPVTAGQTITLAGAGSGLKIDQPANYFGTLTGFTSGQTIDFPTTHLTGIAISNGTIVATAGNANYRLPATVPIGGELSVAADSKGGSVISITPQTIGIGSPALIAVAAPAMLFWASPVGDIFRGPSAEVNGAQIGNWGTTDQLELTDLSPAHPTLSYVQGSGAGTLTVSDGVHRASIGLTGTFTASWFHAASDGGSGTTISYHA